MSTNEEILTRFAEFLGQESYQDYHSNFGRVMKILQGELKIAEGIEAGSLAMGFKIRNSGDLDVIFTYVQTEKTAPNIRSELFTVLSSSLENQAEVTLDDPETSRSVKIIFENEIEMDIVYKDYTSYEREKRMIDHFDNLPDYILHIVRLVKYAEINYSNNKIKKHSIHKISSTIQGNSFIKKLRNTIHRSGGGQVQDIIDYLIREANRFDIN
ncbi:MAG: hypothetical protein KGD59_06755 [Candidatus Heimdallarchaeota archaeon]|nr:hypothetical protein [Candidatus Heimdallarchaeota archaeon]MBY8994234.1 hypothetical protein [Candidatus Heimdallarchaeota archaeon]